ncbi:membrane protein-like protein [Methylobacterium sp. 4-46]|uniref:DUF2157 domain-containing protein n=1 Tax=unclassified Methylobacterium TaxID=2615210 RepID=UPI000165CA5C|nr:MULTISPECIES: DUF2157 domain-containing protein [Methylobacterium]ACA16699.1 membrane protein-like protein [Methylobacterium sp. 4-46]WFT82399.1 DUF2157 domain-containing protein [Methylobacterium nodulans]
MPLSYRDRVLADIRAWAARGLIDAEQQRLLEAELRREPGLAGLQVALGAVAALLVAVAAITFVASNWAGMPPLWRLVLLVAADALAVGLAALATLRHRRSGDVTLRRLADALAGLSVAVSAAALALMGQTFHLPPDLPGYAVTVAVVATATALALRSGSAGGLAAAGLALAAWADFLQDGAEAAPGLPHPAWPCLVVLATGQLSGRIPARTAGFFLLLLPLASAVAVPAAGPRIDAGRLALFALAVVTAAQAASRLPRLGPGVARRLARLARAAGGFVLLALLARAAGLLGAEPAGSAPSFPRLLAGLALVGLGLALPRPRGTPVPIGPAILAGAALVPLALGAGPPSRGAAAAPALVWTVLLPLLAVAVAARLDGRRALGAVSLAACAAMTLGVLLLGDDLIGVALHLLAAGALAALALAATRRLGAMRPARPGNGPRAGPKDEPRDGP